MLPPPLLPDDGDTYNFYVGDRESYDSNLYRVPSGYALTGTVLVPNATKEDYYNTISVGADGQRIWGRQIFDLDLRIDENRFERNTTLNNTSYEGRFLYNWRVSGFFSGTAGADFLHNLAGFDETRYLGRDLVNTERYYGTARYQIGPRWALYGGVADSDINHGAVSAHYADFRTESGNGGIEYATDVNNTYALQYIYSDGRYPYGSLNSLNGFEFRPDFHDQLAQFVMKYTISDKTTITASAGYLRRRYDNTDFGSFSGEDWRVGINWQITEKTQITFNGWRELHAYLISEADYFVSKGGSIVPIWQPRDKIQLSLLFSYEEQSYIPQSDTVLLLGPLRAKVTTGSAAINYLPFSRLTVRAAINYQRRDANQNYFAYADNLVQIGVLYKIH